jgi:pSer/pThr/pTyr-binding forkhead associated (FHA) protein
VTSYGYCLSLDVADNAPNATGSVELHDQEVVIGRSDHADFRICIPTVSRRHAGAWVEGAVAYVRDLGSQRGTFVNHQQITSPTPLRPGDRVSLGKEVHFQVVIRKGDRVAEAGGEDVVDVTNEVEVEPDLPTIPPPSSEEISVEAKPYLTVLANLFSATAPTTNEDDLLAVVLYHMEQIIEAERFYAIVGSSVDDLTVVAEKQSPTCPDLEEIPPSRGIMRRVMYSLSDKPFVTYDAQSEKGISDRASIVASKVRSVVCVGLTDGKRCLGMLYADSQGPDAIFSSQDESFLQVVGQLTSVKINELRTASELDQLKAAFEAQAGVTEEQRQVDAT